MKFFFPDGHELVDPDYDFNRKHDLPRGIGQQNGLYAHELISPPPYDGILLSRGVIQGKGSDIDATFRDAKYKLSELQRLFRVGATEFFRIGKRPLLIMGDCGAFSYRHENEVPYSVDGVIGFYDSCRVNCGVSVDHVILGYSSKYDLDNLFGPIDIPAEWAKRQEMTLTLAHEFLKKAKSGRYNFEPIGAAQGWSPKSYAHCVAELQKIGYQRIALGGMVSLKSSDVLEVLACISTVRLPETQLHLLGLNRMDHFDAFSDFGVTSIDSTSPLTRAFKDERDNYYTDKRTYSAVRVRIADPKVTRELRQLMAEGKLTQTKALKLEEDAWNAIIGYGKHRVTLEEALNAILEYEKPFDTFSGNADRYRETLLDRPWEKCPCEVCKSIGIHCIIFRGAERNRRRGFHNLYISHRNLQQAIFAKGGSV